MATIGNLIIDISATTEGLRKGLNEAQGLVGGLSGKFGALGTAASAAAGLAAGAIAGVGAAGVAITAQVTDLASQVNQAQNDMQAELGITAAEAEILGGVAVEVWKNNFGENIEDVTDALIEARQQLGSLNEIQLQDVVENAFRLQDAFGADFQESLNAVAVLVEEFGLTEQQAFDFLASGFQRGLNSSDDFLDSVREYGNIFSAAGFDAEQFFGIMESGLQGGVLGTDKIADAIKEFSIRANEGGSAIRDAFGDLGLNFEAVQDGIASGQTTWADLFNIILFGLQKIEDPLERNRLQVAIFGTMAEDMGADFALGLSTATASIEDMGGAIDAVDQRYDNWTDRWEAIKRAGLGALLPVGETILELADRALPTIMEAMERAEPILAAFADQMADRLGPAVTIINESITRIAQALGSTNEETTILDLLLGGLYITLDLIVITVEAVTVLIWGLANSIEFISFLVGKATEKWTAFGDSLAGLGEKMPAWMIPGSPTPFEIGIRGITDALDDLPALDQIGGSMPGLAGVGATTGGGSNITINIDGVSATSVTGGDPADEAIRMTLELLRTQLKRA